LFWNLFLIVSEAQEKEDGGNELHQICTDRADISSILASAMRSSVEGKAVRAYVSLRTFSWAASARFLFFLMVGSSGDVGEIGGGV